MIANVLYHIDKQFETTCSLQHPFPVPLSIIQTSTVIQSKSQMSTAIPSESKKKTSLG